MTTHEITVYGYPYPPSWTTADASAHLLCTATAPANLATTTRMRFEIGAAATDGSAAYFVRELFAKSDGTSASIVGSIVDVDTQSDVPAWSVDISASGASIVINVTGDGSRTVTWMLVGDTRIDPGPSPPTALAPRAGDQARWLLTYPFTKTVITVPGDP